MNHEDIPDVTMIEIAGFSYDLTYEEDRKLFRIALEALEEVDQEDRDSAPST